MADLRIAGVLLAGGRSTRMLPKGGGDKCLMQLGGRTILARVIERAVPQVQGLVLNANGDVRRFAEFGLPMVADSLAGGLGPLAGVLAGLDWAAQQVPRVSHVATFATDTPFFPKCLVPKLAAAVRCGAELACARCQGRLQPLFAMWPVALRADLRRALAHDGARRVDRWMAERRLAEVEFASEGHDPFFNLNEPSDLAAAEALLRRNS